MSTIHEGKYGAHKGVCPICGKCIYQVTLHIVKVHGVEKALELHGF